MARLPFPLYKCLFLLQLQSRFITIFKQLKITKSLRKFALSSVPRTVYFKTKSNNTKNSEYNTQFNLLLTQVTKTKTATFNHLMTEIRNTKTGSRNRYVKQYRGVKGVSFYEGLKVNSLSLHSRGLLLLIYRVSLNSLITFSRYCFQTIIIKRVQTFNTSLHKV